MAKNYSEIIIALAGICQSATLVRQLAQTGQSNETYQTVLFNSLTINNPESALDVFGGDIDNIKLGLKAIIDILNSTKQSDIIEVARYAMSMAVLERKLMSSTNAQDQLRQRIGQLAHQTQFFNDEDDQFINNLAGIYVDVISPLGQKIQVTGSEPILKNTFIQAKIRALLLAGIRSAVLWQQVGGSRWQFILSKKKIIQTAQSLLSYTK